MAQYLILFYAEEAGWEALSPEEMAAVPGQFEEFGKRNAAVIVGGNQLAPTTTATSIRRDGSDGFLVTDGAFVETKEALGGYYLIDVETLDEAIAVAKQVPVPIAVGGVEVRPIIDLGL
jgi:hypothetical protein